ncbi:cytochrome c oxidase accessory protein CcoG [Aquincola sp. MAHUQ-54]|uniref:Cytochrome c oxidase accessory protein CcoG n=1 Tax=Aquincola agrisoli TaxID=3119538 RepID=A0AAW9Q1E5_9BURK
MSPVPSSAVRPASDTAGAKAAKVVWLYESHKKVYPRSVKGWFASWRWVLVWATQILYYGLPWLQWDGRPAVLFDLGARRFYIFELILYPQDFIYLTGLLILSAYGLFFFTAVGGRLWCGYACPQTVYTEIFLWVEHKFEGERGVRMKLDAGPWTVEKLWRKGGKHAAWLAIALWTGFTFVGYFTPIRTLWAEAFTLSFGPWEWFWVLFYGFATYGNAGFMREQVCKYMCPYARFQSAMFDHDTLIVSYDEQRGEPRGKRGRKDDKAGKGDCIDCGLCVQVCPTGIDIRDGLQYECIACTACIDACNGVMDKMQYPRGLIRYATQNALALGEAPGRLFKRLLRPRVLVYGAVLVAISAAFVASLMVRSPLKVDVVRDRASLARIVDDGRIENVYRLQLMNASGEPQRYRVEVGGLPGLQLGEHAPLALQPAEAHWFVLQVQLPPEAAQTLGSGAHPIQFRVVAESGDRPADVTEKSTFIVPR